jgi:hypothetical protein
MWRLSRFMEVFRAEIVTSMPKILETHRDNSVQRTVWWIFLFRQKQANTGGSAVMPKSFRPNSWKKFNTRLVAAGAVGRPFAWFLLRGGAILILAGPLLFCAQFLVGLKRGVWPALDLQTISNAAADPQSMLSSISAIPLWIVVLMIGCVMLYLGEKLNRTLDRGLSM